MKTRTGIAMVAALSAATAGSVHAGGAGTTAANFLKIGAGARPVAMGETFIGTADDISALYWNPSGLAQLGSWELQLMHGAWMQDVNYEYFAVGGPVGAAGTFALSVTGLLSSGIPGYTLDAIGAPSQTSDLSVAAFGGTIGYGQRLDTILGLKDSLDIAIGGSVKFVSQNLGGSSHVAYAADLGALWRLNENFQIGTTLADIGTSNIGFSTPTHFRLGAGYMTGSLMTRGDRLTAGSDVTFWSDETPKFHLGLEYAIPFRPLRAAIRFGYKIIPDTGPIAGLTFGGGLALITQGSFELALDYALVPYGELGISHRLGLGVKF